MKKEKIESYWNEEWKDFVLDLMKDKSVYKISNYGRIISYFYTKEGVLLKLGKAVGGYRTFNMTDKHGKKYREYVHRLVAMFFLDKPREDQTVVIHLDNNKDNNYYRNLKWGSEKERYAHHLQFNPNWSKQPGGRAWSKLTESDVKLIKRKLFDPKRKTKMKILARQFGVSEMQLYRIKSGENWSSVKPD